MATWVFLRDPYSGMTVDLTPDTGTVNLNDSPAELTDGSVTAFALASTADSVTYSGLAGNSDTLALAAG